MAPYQRMDLTLRVLLMEGVFGKTPYTWARKDAPILILRRIVQDNPGIDISWADPKDFGWREHLLKGVRSADIGDYTQMSPEEVVQEMALQGTKQGKNIYWEIGHKNREAILQGKITPKWIANILWYAGKNRAVDVARRYQTRSRRMSPTIPAEQEVDSTEALSATPLSALLSVVSGPAGRRFRRWLRDDVVRSMSPMQAAVLRAWLRDPEQSQAAVGRSPEVMQVKGKPISGQMAGRYMSQILRHIRDNMDDPMAPVWDFLDRQQLGYGGGSLRVAYRHLVRQIPM